MHSAPAFLTHFEIVVGLKLRKPLTSIQKGVYIFLDRPLLNMFRRGLPKHTEMFVKHSVNRLGLRFRARVSSHVFCNWSFESIDILFEISRCAPWDIAFDPELRTAIKHERSLQ